MYSIFRTYFLLVGVAQVVLPVWGSKCQCGVSSASVLSMRIGGGERVAPHSQPWMVALVKNNLIGCGATLLTDKHVLSAGHCLTRDFRNVKAFIGLDDFNDLKNVDKRNISDVVIYDKFTSTVLRDDNDIGLATLSSPVQFGDTILPICLPRPGEDFSESVGIILGWGRTGVAGPTSNVLLKASLRIETDEECINSKLKELTPTMMCAFSLGKDSCMGDSGGPLLVYQTDGRYVQAGITSWGMGCLDKNYPGVYTKVSNYIDWIKRHSAGGKTCE